MSKDILKNQVSHILSHFPEARNSDIRLTIELWKNYYPNYIIANTSYGVDNPLIAIKDLFELPREDNIKRIRAKIQNEDREFLPTDIKVFIERARASDEWRRFLGYRVNKLPEVLTDADIKTALESYLSEPAQKALFNL